MRLRLVLPIVAVAACSPTGGPVVDRPDVLREPDAAVYVDGGSSDAPARSDTGIDATIPADADPDAAATADTGPDAAVVDAALTLDAGAAMDAPPPRDAGPTWTIGFCRVQFPTTLAVAPGVSTIVYGRVFAAGLTTRSGRSDTDPLLLGEVGSGADGTHPSTPGWTWTRAAANVAYGPGSAGYEANNDEYEASLSLPSIGSYDFAYRFSGDGGSTWTYCDTMSAGSSDGYQTANAGSLTVM